ncbi:inositol-tetrakisphosphate 1-kinase-like [Dendronephthya gigantea]|uniref:inositol-tetrakisphosphate 1-kinase-like n=1 Tax=Dendronephthya gigantea TaxID=151771 RepID=UPI001069B61E|nr:inositol-tetrakisphosphate 1-kinase-like [Dendronephthya gigantea]XP_028413835.1 inositol-tetrakisphosphate 1-kinase-like [Dendronephthya gigantea]
MSFSVAKEPGSLSSPKKLAFWLSKKKKYKLNFESFLTLCSQAGFELIEIDLSKPWIDECHVDVLIHKVTDFIAAAENGDLQAFKAVQKIETFIADHPEVVVIDPVESVRLLSDRSAYYPIMRQCEIKDEDGEAFIPNFVSLESADRKANMRALHLANIKFPFICKTNVAHGSDESHEMSIIFNEEGLQDITPPCVCQEFVNHNAILYKVFVIGNKHYISERPSIKNLQAGDFQTIFFHSHDVSKPNSSSFLNQLEKPILKQSPPDEKVVKKLVDILKRRMRLTLFGVDVIVERKSRRIGVIDINYFPGYEGVDSAIEDLFQHTVEVLRDHQN